MNIFFVSVIYIIHNSTLHREARRDATVEKDESRGENDKNCCRTTYDKSKSINRLKDGVTNKDTKGGTQLRKIFNEILCHRM